MVMYLGDYNEDDTVYFLWSTNDADGASITRATDGTVQVYKDNGATQSVAGVTDTEDFDSLTGVHACTINLSADAFYATGADYAVVVAGATIDGQTVNAVLAHFSIENRYPVGQLATKEQVADQIWDEATSGHTTGGTFGEQVKTDVDAILADTNELQTDDVPGLIGALNDVSTAEVNAQVDTAIEDYRLDELFVTALGSQPTAASMLADLTEDDGGTQRFNSNALEEGPSAGTNPNVLVSTTIDGVTSQTEFTLVAGSNDDDAYNDQAIVLYDASDSDFPSVRTITNYTGATKTVEIDAAPDFTIISGDGVKIFVTAPGVAAPTAAVVADAVWDEAAAGHTDAGKAGLQLWTDIDAVLADTNELQTDNVPGLIGALNDVSTAEVNAQVDVALVDAGLDHLLSAAVVGADVTDDSVIAQLVSKSGTADWDSFDNETDSLEAIVDGGGGAPTAAAIADAVWDEATSGHTTGGTFGEQAKTDIDSILADTGTNGVLLAASELNDIADALLKRNFSSVSGEANRSMLNAMRRLRNKTYISAGVLYVTQEDDSSVEWQANLTTDAAADPITAVDPTT